MLTSHVGFRDRRTKRKGQFRPSLPAARRAWSNPGFAAARSWSSGWTLPRVHRRAFIFSNSIGRRMFSLYFVRPLSFLPFLFSFFFLFFTLVWTSYVRLGRSLRNRTTSIIRADGEFTWEMQRSWLIWLIREDNSNCATETIKRHLHRLSMEDITAFPNLTHLRCRLIADRNEWPNRTQ